MRVSREIIDRSTIWILAQTFDFPSTWHSPISVRPYRRTVAKMINDLGLGTVVEVGCGLGSILVLVEAKEIHGYDIDQGVVKAARLIRSKRIHFHLGTLEDVHVALIDVLVLVNWIHEIDPVELEERLLPIMGHCKYLLLDAIDPDNDYGYRHKHDFAFLSGLAELMLTAKCPGEGRSFQLFRMSNGR
jgi:hypothetical protein